MRLAANRTYNVDKSHRNPLHFAAGSYRFQSLQRRRMALKSDIPVSGDLSEKFLQDSYKFCTGAAMVDTTIPVNLNHKFSLFSEYWRPKVAAQLNGQEVKLVKFKGEFIWHHHDEQDEMFLVWKGRFRVDFRDHSVELHAGELLVVPGGLNIGPQPKKKLRSSLFEPAETRNTGNVADDKFTAPGGVSI